MPRCQRTFRRLGRGETRPEKEGRCWVCPFCVEAETYETIHDADLQEYAAQAQAVCFSDFGQPSDASYPVALISGLYTECVREPTDRRYEVYLQNGASPSALRLQIGHELFHRTCSQGRIFHWTHEMLACLISVRLLQRFGESEYAEQREREYAAQAELLPVTAMLCADLSAPPYPPGLYGRAFVTGQRLERVAGWSALCRLARSLDSTGQPDIRRWLARFPADVRSSVSEILTGAN